MANKTQKAVVELIVNGRSSEVSLNKLGQAVKTVTKELRDMAEADDPKAYAEKVKEQNTLISQYIKQSSVVNSVSKELKAYHEHQKDINKAALQGQNLMSKFLGSATGNIAKGVVSGSFIVKGIEKLAELLPGLISGSGKLSDELSDVQKQTGIYGKELGNLNEELKTELDTRTKLEELRKFAALAGKNGFETKDDVLAFVRAADVINVALGEDLKGNTEDVINEIGKITKIFNLDKEFGIEKGMLKVASAINTVGASSEANEGYLVEWAKDFAGIAPNAKVSIADTLGLAAAMDITGQSSALSTTNIGKMMIAMGKDVPYFAKLAKSSVKDFSDLLQTDGNAAFIKVLEGAKSTTNGVEGLAKTLDAMGIEGTEGAQILGVLTNNLDLVKQQQAIANAEMAKGTSVLEEFNVKNNNTAAILEKIGKMYDNFMESAAGALSPLIQNFGLFIGVVSELDLAVGAFTEQQKRVMGLENTLNPLISRYEELKSKTSLSTDEQTELQKIIVKVGEVLPNSVTRFDEYGNAIDISTTKAKEAIEVQKQLLKTLNAEAIKQVDSDMRRAELSKKNMRKLLDDKSGVVEYRGREGYVTVPRSDERTAEIIKNYKDANKELDELRQKRKELTGEFDFGVSKTVKTDTQTTTNTGSGLSKSAWDKQKKENARAELQQEAANKRLAEKLEQESDRLTEELIKNQQKLTLNALGEYEKELRASDLHYEELRTRANGNAEQLAQIDEQARIEIEQITDKYNQKFLTEKEAFIKQVNELGLNAEGNEIAKINSDYDQKLADAERFGLSTVVIEKARLDAIEKVRNAADERERQKAIENFKFKVDHAEAEGNTLIPIIRARLDEIDNLITKSTDKESKAYHELVKEKNELLKEERNIAREQVVTILKTFEASSEALSNILTLVANDQSQFAEFQRALAIFQIAIETSLAVANAISSSTKGDSYTMALRIATAIATVTAGFVKVKTIMNEAKQPKTPTFADGGFTDRANITPQTTGFIDRATLYSAPNRRFIAGEAGREFIMGNQILQHPAVAAYANMIDSIQKTRNFGALDQISAATASSNSNNAELIAEFRALRAEFKAYQQNESKRPVDFSFDKFNRKNDFWLNVKKDATA